MRVLKSSETPAASDWEGALRKLSEQRMIPRKPGHETRGEIMKRLGIGDEVFGKLMAANADRVEVGEMSHLNAGNRMQRVKTYRLKLS